MVQVNLHQHSEGSFLDGLARVAQIAKRASELGSQAVAITDHNEVNQHLAFQKACRAEGIKPLLGIEADWVYSVEWTRNNLKYPSNRSHICMLAENNQGLSNIWAMSTLAYSKPYKYKKPLLTPALMREYSEGVYASDGCMITELGRAIEAGDEDRARQHFSALLNIYGDHFYSELHTWQFIHANTPKKLMLNALMGEINRAKVQFATEMGVPLVVVNDSHHAYPHEWENKELIWKFNTHKKSKDDDQDDGDEYGQKADHLMGDDELYVWMERHGVPAAIVSEAIKNAEHIASKCNAEIVKTLEMPRLTQSEADDLHILMTNVQKGFQQKVIDAGLPQDVYGTRLEEEMSLIATKKFAGYFNVEQDLVDATVSGRWAGHVEGTGRKPMLIGPGRGSAGGCLVAYLLGITTLDPIHYDLMFERFLDPDRDDNPDIDLDFPQSMRPDAKAYLETRYGHDHVCTIQTLSRSQPKAVLRDVARALQKTPDAVDTTDVVKMSKIIDQVKAIEAEVDEGVDTPSWDEVLERKGGELAGWAKKYPKLFTKINEMSGMVRQSSRHASGVVLSNQPLLGTIPLRTRADTPGAITQFDMYEVEELGACKMDLLGLRHLDTLMYARNLIYQRHGVWLDYRKDQLPREYWGFYDDRKPATGRLQQLGYSEFADPAIWPQIAAGHTTGIFQLETPDLTRHAIELKPQNELDVAALISIVRPGVKDAGLGQVYLDRRSGRAAVEYDHPLMESITKETYGVLVYQEQLLKAVKQLAGFTPGEANDLRRALGKKKMEQVLGYKDKFIDGCSTYKNIPTKVAENIWKSIEAAGRYAFNKSHAMGYAVISTWETWTRYYFPIESVVALMATDGENLNNYVREARRLKFPVLPPDINRSAQKFTIEGNSIRYGIDSLRGIGMSTGKAIQRNRPYASLADYLDRAEGGANKGVVYNLIRVGAFDTLGTRERLLQELQYLRAIEDLAESTKTNPERLQKIVDARLARPQYAIEIPDFDDPQVVYEIENELVGNYITVDPMGPYLDVIAHHCIADPMHIDTYERKAQFNIGGQVTEVKPWVIKKPGKNKGKEMAFLNVQWNELDFDITCFADTWVKVRDLIKVGVPVIFRVERDDRGCHLIDLERLDLLRRRVS